MVELSTRYLGLSLSSPLVVSASPLSQDVAQIGKMGYLVHDVYDVVKALLAGARVVMMTSALMQRGIAYLGHVRHDLERWLGGNGWKSVLEIQGKLSRHAVADPAVFERVNYMQVVSSYEPPPPGRAAAA